MSDRLLVLYDGDCGICVQTAGLLRRWDRHECLELLMLQSAPTDERSFVRVIAARHPLHGELHVVDQETNEIRSGGSAVLEIVARLPGGRLPAAIGRLPPSAWVIGMAYSLVARNRRAIGRALRLETACRLPEPKA